MTQYLLYYAGMATDLQSEQIGLAVSADGHRFERAGEDGLVVPRDPSTAWRSLRVCNPTVWQEDGRFLMMYQGIAAITRHVSIGLAESYEGEKWALRPRPCLSWERMREVDSAIDPQARVMVIEPAILRVGSRLRMWFVYAHKTQPGNALWCADSDDGEEWTLEHRPVLRGNDFGPYLVHYPQVLRHGDGYELYFTLRSEINGTDGIFRMRSSDGREWAGLEQLLPRSSRPPSLEPRNVLPVRLPGVAGRAVKRLDRKLAQVALGGRNRLGFSHPHVLAEPDGRVMYYHSDNEGVHGRWLDIGRCLLHEDGHCTAHEIVLSRSTDPSAWDAYFVGDPFVLKVEA